MTKLDIERTNASLNTWILQKKKLVILTKRGHKSVIPDETCSVASNFLLFEEPLGAYDLVRE